MEIKIVNTDESGIGEIWVKGENVTKGYYENEIETQESFSNEWFKTGDLGIIDKDGYLIISGRLKNLIVLENGKKIFPEEIELKLKQIQGIKDALVYLNNSKLNAKIVYEESCFENKDYEDIYNYFKNEIHTINLSLPIFKNIVDFEITSKELAKTQTGKIKREEISKVTTSIIENFQEKGSLDTVKYIIRKQLEYTGTINDDSDLAKDLGADSLDLAEIFLEIEKEFSIKINNEERKNVKSVQDIIKCLKNKE